MLLRNSIGAGVAAMAILFTTAFNNNVLAAPIFADGDVITYWQTSWGEPGTTAGQLLSANYSAAYAPSGVLDLRLPGSSMTFTGAQHVLAYLPASGSSGTLTGINDNPTSTTSGSFGGDVLALRLNVDFADHGVTDGTSPIVFGDLRLFGFTGLPLLNEMSVREFLTNVNSLLGNGPGVYNIGLLAPFLDAMNQSFQDGVVTTFAEDHLRFTRSPTQVPEPATAGLVLLGLLALGLVRRRSRV